ncbi:lethal giant larvae like, C-terminal-domain-containing protein [Suillus subalutaceus]|uniref:lethal giant larvae like, C-terminal-domain-containing protein n=1 Tax=Suillus subalutaceus TaxID=48586 RepID=UPI001B87B790|nr:lethal giant larvae like, C-terminal-domain-containing protein [Suillus subalutaceus]KAG1864661.1 lethal giant larvae like, C-terminal-domain-containing protein [Suillus subalutaceus]
MFGERHVLADLSTGQRDPDDWEIGRLRTVDYLLDTRVLTYEPTLSLLAVGTTLFLLPGTASGLICVVGGPGVESSVQTPEGSPVKILQLAASTDKLLSVDERDRLHIWNLKDLTEPPKSTRFDHAINAVMLSPSHTHIFLALQSGEIRTYDLLCLKKSSYVIPNLWNMFQTKIASSVVDPLHALPGCNIPVDLVAHPRDLNLIFVAFGGGVVLYDLSSRNILRAYELVIPAGAPGGGGYHQSEVLTHRWPSVTSVAIHPAGHFFAVGYADGCIAFWAVEDEDQPLMVRTSTDLDVNVINGEELENFLQNGGPSEDKGTDLSERQPIYRVAWCGFPNSSDPRGGATALVFLGGDRSDDPCRLTVHTMPALNSPEPPAPSGSKTGLHASIRKAMRLSVIPLETTYYLSSGPIYDFVLFPKSNPHFSGCWDPVAVLFLTGASDSRIIEARQFLPPNIMSSLPGTEIQNSSEHSDVIHDLSATLEDMALSAEEPLPMHVPSKLYSGLGGVFYAQLLTLQRSMYDVLVGQQLVPGDADLPIAGGSAWIDDKRLSELRLSRSHPRRVLITCHRDLTVRFHDASPQLLISSSTSPLQKNYPFTIHDLTIDLSCLPLSSASELATVQLAPESLECVVLLKSGDLVVYRLNTTQVTPPIEIEGNKEFILLGNVSLRPGTRYHPFLMLPRGNISLTCCALSDIGFVGVGYIDGSVAVINLRGPSLLRPQRQKRQSKLLVRNQDADPVVSLTWTVSTVSMDAQLAVRLIAIHESGNTQIFKIIRDPESSLYDFAQDVTRIEGLPNVMQGGSFVIDSQKGTTWRADRSRFAASLQTRDSNPARCLWVTASARGARCTLDISGERISKVEWNSKKNKVGHVQVIEKNNSHVLVAFNDKPEAMVYSLPYLEHLHTFSLAKVCENVVSVDETGDFIASRRHESGVLEQIVFGTLFQTRRVYDHPIVDLTSSRHEIPPYPQPVSVGPPSLLGTWFRYGKPIMTGEQLDSLLAGPDRPIPPPDPVETLQDTTNSYGPGVMKTMENARSGVYNRLNDALAERGEMLGNIEQRIDSLQQGSKDMVAQAKRLATEQSARRWFGF